MGVLKIFESGRKKNLNQLFVVYASHWRCFYVGPATLLGTMCIFSCLI